MSKTKTLRAMETDHLVCRSLNHSWDIKSTRVVRSNSKRAFHIELGCLRCGATRHDRWSLKAEVEGRRYTYADGYLVASRSAWGSHSLFNANVRKELMKRLLEEAR